MLATYFSSTSRIRFLAWSAMEQPFLNFTSRRPSLLKTGGPLVSGHIGSSLTSYGH